MEKTEQYVIYCDHHFYETIDHKYWPKITEEDAIKYAENLHSLTGVEVVVKKETVEVIWKGDAE